MSARMCAWTARLDPETLATRTEGLVAQGQMDGERSIMVHDLDRMERRVAMLQGAFPPGALHAVAVKANPLVAVLERLVAAGAGLECASIEEVELSLAAGCPPKHVVFDSPAKTREELAFSLAKGLHLNLDNFDELARVAAFADDGGTGKGGGLSGHVGLRINPQVGSGTISMTSVAGRVSKFGIPLESHRAELLEAYARHDWLDGIHVHVGSQGCEMSQLVEAVVKIEAFRQEASARRSRPITEVDIGGGLPVAYKDSDRPPELEDYAAALRDRASSLYEPPTRVLTEFGRCVHAGCGWAISRVEYVKGSADAPMAVLHLGADAFMRRVYKPEDWHHDFLVLDARGRLKQGPTKPVTLVGPLCFGGDVLARDVELPAISEDDLVVVRDCGAYTLSMWSRHCSRGLPKVVGWRQGECTVLKGRETPQDVVAFWR